MQRRIGIIMNGVTGREGTHQHLVNSILKIQEQGGVPVPGGDMLWPDPILVGRDEKKLSALAARTGVKRFTTDLDLALSDSKNEVFFDSSITAMRTTFTRRAIDAGKAIYIEKPTAESTEEAVALYQYAKSKGVKNGVVQDKVLYPGLVKLKYLIDTGFFGTITSIRGDFGYWIFDGFHQRCQRGAWNHVVADGGGMVLDMYPHWAYVIGDLFGDIQGVFTRATTGTKRRVDENGRVYDCDADDTAMSIFELANGQLVQWFSSWAVRVHRRDLWAIQVDGTRGSATAGMTQCHVQSEPQTPRPIWNPDAEPTIDYLAGWSEVPTREPSGNANKAQWELFLKHVAIDAPFRWNLLIGAKGVQLAELSLRSAAEKKWIDVPPLA